jgi:hypothetical protein
MAVKLTLKNSKVQFKNATGAQLGDGELAINYHESGPYGTVHALGGVYINGVAPSNPLPGRWWFDSSVENLCLYDGETWQIITGGGGGGGGTIAITGGDGITVTGEGNTKAIALDLSDTPNGLSIVNSELQADIATTFSLGTVQIGSGLEIQADGTLSTIIDDNQNLDYVAAPGKGTVTITDGNSAEIPLADSTNAGLFTSAEKDKLNAIEAGAEVNPDLSSYVQEGDNVSVLNNDAGYITTAALPAVGDGKITIQKVDATEIGSFTVNQSGDTTITLPADTVPSAPGEGVLSVKDADGTEVASFSANQATGSTVTVDLPDPGVTQITAGTGIEIDTSTGNVTINSTVNALQFAGPVDVTDASTIPVTRSINELYVNTGEGNFATEWAAITGNATTADVAYPGDYMLLNTGSSEPESAWTWASSGAPTTDSTWVDNGLGKLYPATIGNDVGIGTASPATKLHVNGDITFGLQSAAALATDATGKIIATTLPTPGQPGVTKVTGGTGVTVTPAEGTGNITIDGFSGDYNSLSNKPTIPPDPAITSNGTTPSLNDGISAEEVRTLIGAGTSSFDGSYDSLTGKPAIPAYQNLGYSAATTTGSITITNGTNATIPAATTDAAGLLTKDDKSKLDGIQVNATNTSPAAILTDGQSPSLNTNITGAEVRTLIGAGTSSFDGSYNSLSNKPTIPAAANNGTTTLYQNDGSTQVGQWSANQSGVNSISLPDYALKTEIPVVPTALWSSSSGKVFPATLSDNVGIGKNDPETKLDVQGDIAATNFRIDKLQELPAA